MIAYWYYKRFYYITFVTNTQIYVAKTFQLEATLLIDYAMAFNDMIFLYI